jgi:hypothetical protein
VRFFDPDPNYKSEICLHELGKQTFCGLEATSPFDLGCVKTLFKSKFAANLPDFRKFQFAKALISLKLKFGQLGFNHNLIRSLTFSHSLDPKRTFHREFDR